MQSPVLTPKNIELLKEKAKEYKMKLLAIFGSYAREEQKEESDLDILVDFEESPSLLSFIRMENELSDLLGVKVDLVTKNSLHPILRKTVLKEMRIVYGEV
ncbi:MAG: nucleotidyltransferase family protein [Candidatus Lokiarchaeota archaeon]|nr:nucleotidyltransferase family protein [Candidatus Lokiarchaeota archaeon]